MLSRATSVGLNESPYEKVGKCPGTSAHFVVEAGLNESPYEKVGKSVAFGVSPCYITIASMKVPTKK